MNILYTNFHARNGGGHVTYILNLLHGLVRDHSVTVATPRSSRLYRLAAAIPGVKVIDMAYSTRPSSWLAPRARLRSLLLEGRFDLVHANGSADHKQVMLALLGLRRRPAVVLTKHNDHTVQSMGHGLRARFATDRVIAVSDFIRDILLRSPYRRCGVVTVRHGIDTEFFAPVDSAKRLALRDATIGIGLHHKIVLGSSAGSDFDKGWLDLVEGISLLPDALRERFHVVVIGDPPNPQKIARVAELRMTDSVSFPGLLDDVRPTLAACDAGFVLSYREALSFACRELMALGLPVLVTRIGGLPENLDDGVEGWIVPMKDPRAIASVLERIAADPAMLGRMGQAARARAAQEFNLPLFVRRTLDVYQSALRH